MIDIKGNLLMFNKCDLRGYIFPPDCEIELPKLGYIMDGNRKNVIGKITNLTRNNVGITIEATIFPQNEKYFKDAIDNRELYFSGYYKNIRMKVPKDNGIQSLYEMSLVNVSLIYEDVYGDNSLLVHR